MSSVMLYNHSHILEGWSRNREKKKTMLRININNKNKTEKINKFKTIVALIVLIVELQITLARRVNEHIRLNFRLLKAFLTCILI